MGPTYNSGYGQYAPGDGIHWLAHRYSWTLANGPIEGKGTCVLHHCDNPQCVNPAHLFLGTRADNMVDAVLKGRMTKRQTWAIHTKLTWGQVKELRRMRKKGMTYRELGERFGVSVKSARRAALGLSWKWNWTAAQVSNGK